MFQSLHPEAARHAAARAVSGGPVYISDKPGQHDPLVLKQIALLDGSTLRPRRPALPTRDTLFRWGPGGWSRSWDRRRFPLPALDLVLCPASVHRNVQRDGETGLKVASVNEHSGVVAAFNVQGQYWDRASRRFVGCEPGAEPVVSVHIRPTDVHEIAALESLRGGASDGEGLGGLLRAAVAAGLTSSAALLPGSSNGDGASEDEEERMETRGGLYVAFTRGTGALRVLPAHGAVAVDLARSDVEVVTFAPLLAVPGAGGPANGSKRSRRGDGLVAAAVIGIKGMMNPGGAVMSLALGDKSLVASIRATGGLLIAYSSSSPAGVTVDGRTAGFAHDAATGAVEIVLPDWDAEAEARVHSVVLSFA